MIPSNWTKTNWREFPINQTPNWPDLEISNQVVNELSRLPALVFAGETRNLRQHITEAGNGQAFILQVGDCAEEFSRCTGPGIHNFVRIILQMSVILAYVTGKRIVNIGRIAGQYAKPRSSMTELIDGMLIPSYRGDMVNCVEPTLEARQPDPRRMIEGYFRSAATLNLVRAFMQGGYAELDFIKAWHHDFDAYFAANPKYEFLTQEISHAISFFHAIGETDALHRTRLSELFTSHEALLLDYEEAMTRVDTTTGDWYDTSAHFLWIGDRTRQPDSAHIEFLRGVNNPIGIKIGPDYNLDDICAIIRKLNPSNLPGRITLITRFGVNQVEEKLAALIEMIQAEVLNVTWICDPMHGNTIAHSSGTKTRLIKHILAETEQQFTVHRRYGTQLGGIQLEIVGDHVTECIFDESSLKSESLEHYLSTCDPRLNAEQSVDFAFRLAKMLEEKQ